MLDIRTAAGYAVFAVFGVVVLAALGSWLVRTRRISPFSALGRGLRSATDWIIMPVERRIVRMGGNPVHAGGWLIVIVAVVGVIFLSLLGWVLTNVDLVQWAASHGGPRAVLAMVIEIAYNVLIFALIARVIGSWFGVFRYNRWMRPAYMLTDWVVEPVRRFVPPIGGAMDVSPLVAWFVLWALKKFLLLGLGF